MSVHTITTSVVS